VVRRAKAPIVLASRAFRAIREFVSASIFGDKTVAIQEQRMKTLFQQGGVDEGIGRIDRLQPASARQWGKMGVSQMMGHCSAALDMASVD
jgi:hypothetical protein